MSSIDTTNLAALGQNSSVARDAFNGPHADLLERFENPFKRKDLNACNAHGAVKIVCPEFTSLCPKTGQPDFATIVIEYDPADWCVESKSLKLYLMSFRNVGEFHEACIARMCNDLVKLLQPTTMSVRGEFTPRGGIPFWPTATYFDPKFYETSVRTA